jgi:hypothetical protein
MRRETAQAGAERASVAETMRRIRRFNVCTPSPFPRFNKFVRALR